MVSRDPATEKRIQQLAVALYGLEPQVQRCHSENSYVCRLDFGGPLPDKVIKYARRNSKQVLREQAILRVLGNVGLQVPGVEFTQDDSEIESSPFTIMPRFAGTSLQDGCWSGAEWVEPALRRAGSFLAHLSTLPPDLLEKSLAGQETAWNTGTLPKLGAWTIAGDLDQDEFRAFEGHLRRIDQLASRRETGTMHGSYSPAHILCAPDGTFVVIDWENAGPGSVLRDIGHFLASLQTWTPGEPGHVDWFVAGYQDERPLGKADWAEIRDWEMLTYLIWANFFAGQGRQEQAAAILSVARDRSCV